jgi:hypothetical protein
MKGMQKIIRGSGFKGVLSYALEGKDHEEGHGRLLGGSMAGTTVRELAAEFRAIARMRPDIEKPVWHNSLRMPAGEDISDERWNAIAKSYLKRMQFDLKHTQYAVFKHDDAHVHLVVNRVLTDGSVFLGRNENLLSTQVIQRLERAFKLTLTPGPRYGTDGKIVMPERSAPRKNEIEQATRLGIQPARLALQARVATALQGRPTTSEFLARLDAAGVQAVPSIASTMRMNGFAFEWDGIAFTGSQLGAAYKWAAIQQKIEYDQTRDSEELARRQAQARHRRADEPAAGSVAGAAPEPGGPGAAAGEPAAPDRHAAAGDLDAGASHPAAGAGFAPAGADAALPAGAGFGQAAPGDRGGTAEEGGRDAGDAGRPRNASGEPERNQGRAGPHRDAGHGLPPGQPGASLDAGQREAPDLADSVRVFEDAERLVARHDEDAKVAAWRQQAAALGAPAYRVMVTEGLRPFGFERAAPAGQDALGEPGRLWSAGEVEALIPALRVASNSGFDVDLTPVDTAHHFLVVQGLRPETLAQARAQGYAPALVQQTGKSELQAVLKVPRESGRDDEESLLDALSLELNTRWASQDRPALPGVPTGRERALAMAGFVRHGPGKSAKSEKGALTVILEALGRLCRKTLAGLAALRRQADHDGAQVQAQEREQQRAHEKKQEVAKLLRQEEAQVYWRHAAEASSESPDQVDLEVAKNMLKAGHLPAEVRAVLRASPGLAERHLDVQTYVKEAVKKAQKALNAAAP